MKRITLIVTISLAAYLSLGATALDVLALRVQLARAQIEIATLKKEAERQAEYRKKLERWNSNFILWLCPIGKHPGPTGNVPEIAMRYCMENGGPNVLAPPECWFADIDKDRDVDQDDVGLWQRSRGAQ